MPDEEEVAGVYILSCIFRNTPHLGSKAEGQVNLNPGDDLAAFPIREALSYLRHPRPVGRSEAECSSGCGETFPRWRNDEDVSIDSTCSA